MISSLMPLAWVLLGTLTFVGYFILMAYIRYEVRIAILDYANRLKVRQSGPTQTPYDEWCSTLRKELAQG